jgi:DNA-binding transcriptional ArsR family regulator
MANNQEIRGNTLKVYLYLLKHGPSELREIQHGLELSSASLASYHLGKLIEAGYVSQDEVGKYYAIKDAETKVLEGYSKVGPALVPQLFFFSLLFTILAAFFSFEALDNSAYILYLVLVCIVMVIVFWTETLRIWRRLTA